MYDRQKDFDRIESVAGVLSTILRKDMGDGYEKHHLAGMENYFVRLVEWAKEVHELAEQELILGESRSASDYEMVEYKGLYLRASHYMLIRLREMTNYIQWEIVNDESKYMNIDATYSAYILIDSDRINLGPVVSRCLDLTKISEGNLKHELDLNCDFIIWYVFRELQDKIFNDDYEINSPKFKDNR